MDEETLNLSIRKFLKTVGVKSQREIELTVAKAIAAGKLSGQKSLPATMKLHVGKIDLDLDFQGTIDLE